MILIKEDGRKGLDFKGTFQCEHCGDIEVVGIDYKDDFYKTVFLPNLRCLTCGETSRSLLEKEQDVL